jgi:hypothetical protein
MPTHFIKVAGLDPSMRNFGMVKGELDIISSSFFPDEIELIKTNTGKDTKTVRKNSDDLRRASEMYTKMSTFLEDVSLVFVEIPVGSQSARAMASYGMCIGVLASIQGKGLIQVTPTEVKLAACNKKTATKKEMIAWATNKYPSINWFTRKLHGVQEITGANEHIADAIAAVHAGMKTNQFIQLINLLTTQK